MQPEALTSETVDDRRRKAESLFSKKRLGEGDLELDESRLAQAIQAERKRKGRTGEEEYEWGSGKKKKVGESQEVTEEELGTFVVLIFHVIMLTLIFTEAYRMNRRITEDPMANYVDEDL